MTNRPSLSFGFWGSVLLVAGMYACSAGDVSSPRTGGGTNSNGNGGSSGNGGGFNGNGGTGNAPLGNGGGFNGNGGSSSGNGGSGNSPLGNGGSGNSPLGNGGSSGSGNGGTTNSGGGFGTGSGGTASGSGGSAGSFVGAGGTAGAGVGGSAGAGGGTPMSVDSVFANAGFGMITGWQGYLYTATYGLGTISPVCPTPCFMSAAKQLCVSGNVPMDPTYGSGALLGWNVNQPMGTTTAGTVALAGTGVTLTFAGSVGGFHVSLLDGAATPTEYCYVIPAAAGTTVQIPFASFVTNCSDPSKAMTPILAATMIQKMQITVQSTPAMAAPFNFCLVNVAVQ